MRKTTLALAIGGLLSAAAAPTQAADLWDIYQLALKNDPTFLQAQANYEATTENKAIARAGYLPSVGVTGSRTITRTSGQVPITYNPTTNSYIQAETTSHDYDTRWTAQLTQPIFNWAAWQAIDQADAQAAQADAEFTAAQESLILRTATAYFNVLNARDTLAADHAATEANAKQLEQAKEKYEVGMSAITDVENAQAAYDQSVANEITAQQQVTTAEENLRAITGQQAGELMEPTEDMPTRGPEPANAQQWVDQALKQNPNVLAAQSQADSADANVGIKRAGHYPTLALTLSHTKNTDSNVSSLPSLNAFNVGQLTDISGNAAMLQLSIPLFEGGGTQAQLSQAERQYDAAMDNVKLVTRQTEQQARTAYLGVLTGVSQVRALRQSVKSNQTSMDATQTGMEVGTRTIVDVLTARQNLLTAQTGFSNARYTYLESLMQLKQAAGNLTESDIKQINALMQVKVPNADMALPESGAETPAPATGTQAAPATAAPAPATTPAPAASTKPPHA
ncbi:MAG: TolC family outer membrane protein [Bacillota bacterium]